MAISNSELGIAFGNRERPLSGRSFCVVWRAIGAKIQLPRRIRTCRQLQECTAMRIHNLYEDANGESHFRDIEVDWVEETPSGKLSGRLPAAGIMFRETTTDYENSWHRAPRRQYVISLAGGISITASDGETRHIGRGEIVLVEDTTGKGHITKSSGDKPRHTIFVPID
jgi:hypothetical protein